MKNKVISLFIGFSLSYILFVIINNKYMINFNDLPSGVGSSILTFLIIGSIFSFMSRAFIEVIS